MKRRMNKIIALMISFIFVSLLATGCKKDINQEAPEEHVAESKNYAITLPGEWKENDTGSQDEMMDLIRSEDGLEVVTLRTEKSEAEKDGIETTEDYFNFLSETVFGSGELSSKFKDTEAVSIGGMNNNLTKYGSVSLANGMDVNVYMVCMESESGEAYYSVIFSGSRFLDKNFKALCKNLKIEEL